MGRIRHRVLHKHNLVILIAGTILALLVLYSPVPESMQEPVYGSDGGYQYAFGGGPTPKLGTTDVRGIVNPEGRFINHVTAASPDVRCRIDIQEGTIGLTKDLKPLDEITILPIDAPTGAGTISVLGQIYDLGPDDATFDPPIWLTFNYNPSNVPAGANPIIHYWDAALGEWVPFEGCVIDPVYGTVKVRINHFTAFTILTVLPPKPEPTPPPPVPEPEPEPVPPAPEPEPEPEPTPPAPVPAPEPEPTVPEPEQEPEPAPVSEAPMNWGLTVGLIAVAIVIIGLLVYFVWWRRRLA